MKTLVRKSLTHLIAALLGSLAMAITAFVLYLEGQQDLDLWHTVKLDEEYREDSGLSGLADYLELEERLFRQLEEEVYAQTGSAAAYELNRYRRGSRSDPARWEQDWNRTFELPHGQPTAAVLLLHGLSDSPYSLRAPGFALNLAGAHVLGLRLPGHGTAPSGLVDTSWQDMAAVVELAVKDLSSRFPGLPLYIVSYSNGASLALNYTLLSFEDTALPRVERMVLIAPQIGVTDFAALAVWQARLGRLLGLDKLAWNSIGPEYDPFKYGSFAINAGDISHRITGRIQSRLAQLAKSGRLGDMPPILAFSSVVDGTVRAPDLITRLFNPLPPGGHELVFFDINRKAGIQTLLRWRPDSLVNAFREVSDMEYRLFLVTNQGPDSAHVVLREIAADASVVVEQPLGLAWPDDVFSLSHIALGFPEHDPLYGGQPDPPSPGVSLGNVALRGERGVLQISEAAMLRQRWNPFYPFLERRMLEFLGLQDN